LNLSFLTPKGCYRLAYFPSAKSQKEYYSFGLLVVSNIIACCIFIHFYDPIQLANDASQYISVAKNYLAGRGFTTSVIYFPEHYHIGGIPVPQTCFPNGFPFFIAALSMVGISPEHAAYGLVLISYCAIPFLVYESLRISGCRWQINLGIALFWYCIGTAWFNVLLSLSEMPFITLTLLSTRVLQRYYTKPNEYIWLVIAGGLGALSFTIRYAGLFFIFALLISVWCGQTKTIKQKIQKILMVSILPAIIIFSSFLLNYLLVGDLKGGNPSVTQKPIIKLLRIFDWSIYNITGIRVASSKEQFFIEVIFAVLIIFVLSIYYKSRLEYLLIKIKDIYQHNNLCRISFFYCIISVICLGILELRTSIGLSDRMLLPLVPYVLIIIGIFLEKLLDVNRFRSIYIYIFIFLALISLSIGQVNVIKANTMEFKKNKSNREQVKDDLNQVFGETTLISFLQSSVSIEHPILSNDSQFLSSIIKGPTIGLTSSNYTNKRWLEFEVKTVMDNYNANYFIFFKNQPLCTEKNVFYSAIDNGNIPLWLTIEIQNENFQLYRKIPGK
jgi:hypothetical protein